MLYFRRHHLNGWQPHHLRVFLLSATMPMCYILLYIMFTYILLINNNSAVIMRREKIMNRKSIAPFIRSLSHNYGKTIIAAAPRKTWSSSTTTTTPPYCIGSVFCDPRVLNIPLNALMCDTWWCYVWHDCTRYVTREVLCVTWLYSLCDTWWCYVWHDCTRRLINPYHISGFIYPTHTTCIGVPL